MGLPPSVSRSANACPILAKSAALRNSWRLPARGFLACVTRSEEHPSELQSLMRSSYAVFCLKHKTSLAHLTPGDERDTTPRTSARRSCRTSRLHHTHTS